MRVADRWELGEELGRGAMGVVFAARDVTTGEDVAVKVHHLSTETGWKGHELFERSARVLQGLDHPALPKVHAFAVDEQGRSTLVRERFDGGTLHDRIARDHRHVSTHELRHLLRRLLELCVYLHGRVPPVVHRDIKPKNLMFRSPSSWDPVLVDFDSVALPRRGARGETIVATPGYAAPEQLAGDASPAVDLYAVGATMLFVATHREPEDLERTELAGALAGLDADVRRCILKLAEPDRFQRYATATQALADLDGKPTASAPRTVRWAMAGAAALTLTIGVVTALIPAGPPPAPTQVAAMPRPAPVTPPSPPPPTPEPTAPEPQATKPAPPPARPRPNRARPAPPASLESKLAGLSPHIQSIRFAYGGYRVPRVELRLETNDTQALDASLRVVRALLPTEGAPEERIGTRSGYAVAYVDLPPEARGERQSTRPFALRGLRVDGTLLEDHGAHRVFGAPYQLKAERVYEKNGVALCCKVERIGEVRGREVVLDP